MEKTDPTDTDKDKLAIAFQEFIKIDFPVPSENDELNDIYFELLEYDGHVAGLVSSYLKGSPINKEFIFRNKTIINSLNNFSGYTEEFLSLKCYFGKLDDMVQMLSRLDKIE